VGDLLVQGVGAHVLVKLSQSIKRGTKGGSSTLLVLHEPDCARCSPPNSLVPSPHSVNLRQLQFLYLPRSHGVLATWLKWAVLAEHLNWNFN
jgi:hypothetical protein